MATPAVPLGKRTVLADADGKPIEFYHGTTARFDAFDFAAACEARHGGVRLGFFFTRSKQYAATYGDIVIAAHLLVTGALRIADDDPQAIMHAITRTMPGDVARYAQQGIDCLFLDDPRVPDFPSEYVVFHRDQVRIVRKETNAP